tara:strand:+ start:725 stop:1171 length:447 start_codon:yes stop_codon:yes gene_type:complete
MPTVVSTLSPLEISSNSNTAIGVSLPFNANNVFTQTFSTRDQIKANLINYVLTNRNERVFNNNFGANLQSLLFENTNSTLEDLSAILTEDIENNFPSIKVRQLKLINDHNNNTIRFELVYSFQRNLNALENLNININTPDLTATNLPG